MGAAASCLSAQDPAPRARVVTNPSIVIRKAGGSYLGIGIAEVDAERAKALNLKEVHGIEVKSRGSGQPGRQSRP